MCFDARNSIKASKFHKEDHFEASSKTFFFDENDDFLRKMKIFEKIEKKDQKSTKISLYLLRDEFFDYNIIKRFCRLGSKQSKTTKQLKIGQIGWKI